MPAVLELSFAPNFRLESLEINWEALALAVIFLVALTLWSIFLRAVPGGRRGDDVVYVVLAVLPGAVVVGRLAHVISFPDAYLADPRAVLDFSRGSLSLVGAVIGGALSGAYVGRLLGRPVASWADAAAGPLLLAIGVGKVAMVLGGAGQGAPTDGPLSIAFGGDGPWMGADPGMPAHPSQLYEGVLTLLAVPLLGRVVQRVRPGGAPILAGVLFLAAMTWWLGARALASVTWRDQPVIGPLGGEQAVTLVALAVIGAWCFARIRAGERRRRRRRRQPPLETRTGASFLL